MTIKEIKKLMRIGEVADLLGYKSSKTIWRLIREGRCVKPISENSGPAYWLAEEVRAIESRIAEGGTTDDIRALVNERHAARKNQDKLEEKNKGMLKIFPKEDVLQ